MPTLTATTALPYPGHPERASAGLRAKLRDQVQPRHIPVWDTSTVEGPVAVTDTGGRTWWEYAATVQTTS